MNICTTFLKLDGESWVVCSTPRCPDGFLLRDVSLLLLLESVLDKLLFDLVINSLSDFKFVMLVFFLVEYVFVRFGPLLLIAGL